MSGQQSEEETWCPVADSCDFSSRLHGLSVVFYSDRFLCPLAIVTLRPSTISDGSELEPEGKCSLVISVR